MDKIFSARLDESIVNQIGVLASELRTSKKAVIENAIVVYSKMVEADKNVDPLERSFGAWKRDEAPTETVRHIRSRMRQSMERRRR